MEKKQISMADAAYEILAGKKRGALFTVLWTEVRRMTGVPKENISRFYEDLTLDPRFVSLKDNKWDLKERRKYSDAHVDVDDISLEDESDFVEVEDEEIDDKKDEDDYN